MPKFNWGSFRTAFRPLPSAKYVKRTTDPRHNRTSFFLSRKQNRTTIFSKFSTKACLFRSFRRRPTKKGPELRRYKSISYLRSEVGPTVDNVPLKNLVFWLVWVVIEALEKGRIPKREISALTSPFRCLKYILLRANRTVWLIRCYIQFFFCFSVDTYHGRCWLVLFIVCEFRRCINWDNSWESTRRVRMYCVYLQIKWGNSYKIRTSV